MRSVWDRHVDFVALEPRLFHLRLQRRPAAARRGPRGAGAGPGGGRRRGRGGALLRVRRPSAPRRPSCARAAGAEAGAGRGQAARAAHDEWRRRGGAPRRRRRRRAPRGRSSLPWTAPTTSRRRCATPTYCAPDDVLDHRQRRATFVDNDASRTVDLRVDEDALRAARGAELSRRHRRVRRALAQLRARANAAGARGGGEADGLAETVGELPRSLERKKRELHTAVLGAAMKQVVAREVPRYAEAEERRAAAADVEGLLGRRGQGHRRRQAAAARRRRAAGRARRRRLAALAAAAAAEGPDRPPARGVAAIGEGGSSPPPPRPSPRRPTTRAWRACWPAQAGAKTVAAAAAASKVGSLLSRASARRPSGPPEPFRRGPARSTTPGWNWMPRSGPPPTRPRTPRRRSCRRPRRRSTPSSSTSAPGRTSTTRVAGASLPRGRGRCATAAGPRGPDGVPRGDSRSWGADFSLRAKDH